MRDFKSRASRIEPGFGTSNSTPDQVDTDLAIAVAAPRDVLMDERPARGRRPAAPQSPLSPADETGADFQRSAPAPSSRRLNPRAPEGFVRAGHRERARSPLINFAWLRPTHFALLIVFGCLAWAYWASDSITQFLERPFKSVVVEGDFRHVSKERATHLIGEEIDSNFLKLDLMRIKNVLIDDPWVDQVTLQRRWPDTLVVKIIEQKPIARWTDGFLNQRGEIVRVDDTQALEQLPWLQGSESNAGEILQQYLVISQRLRTRGLDVIALKCDDKRAWRLTLNNNVEVVLGRGELMQKIQRFLDVYDTHLNRTWLDIISIDARYSNGVAVRWVEGSETAQRYLSKSVAGA